MLIPSARRRGRPCIGDRPMTSTERNRRRLDRLEGAEARLDRMIAELFALAADLEKMGEPVAALRVLGIMKKH